MIIRSQNGMVVCPFEGGVMYATESGAINWNHSLARDMTAITMSSYSSSEKAKKVMDMMCNAYEGCDTVLFQMPLDEDIKNESEN